MRLDYWTLMALGAQISHALQRRRLSNKVRWRVGKDIFGIRLDVELDISNYLRIGPGIRLFDEHGFSTSCA
jgi:hypothetical protein